uniref:Uncharacterized protein n=1 Tax=Acrobeloides nanus TaxID=290746 RepID=A0A914CHC8_9BILA
MSTFLLLLLVLLLILAEARFYRSLPLALTYRNHLEKSEEPIPNNPKMRILDYDPAPAPSVNKALSNHHFVALRPDYAFLNVANVIKSLFDKRN